MPGRVKSGCHDNGALEKNEFWQAEAINEI